MTGGKPCPEGGSAERKEPLHYEGVSYNGRRGAPEKPAAACGAAPILPCRILADAASANHVEDGES